RYCRGCKKRRSLGSNSFFEEFPRISLGKILLCIYFFLEDDSQKSASRKIGLTKEKTSQIYRKLEDVCSVDLEYNPIIPFAGDLFLSQNNRGRRAERDVWVFGIVTIEYTPCRGYFQIVKRRDAATLHPIIEKCILPGTERGIRIKDMQSYLDDRMWRQ
ncbi:unnamed protein product, partial [Porites lobata]